VPPASQAGFEILHALFWLVVRLAEREPLLLLLDDAQWADEPSLRFLLYLLGRLSDQESYLLRGIEITLTGTIEARGDDRCGKPVPPSRSRCAVQAATASAARRASESAMIPRWPSSR